MRSRIGVCSLVALCALVVAAAGQAAVTPGTSTVAGGPSEQQQALVPSVLSTDRHATAASWHEGSMVQAGTINCVTGFVEVLGGSYVGWFGEVGASPVVNQTYYIKVGWGISGNPCTGGAYVHTEIQLPSFTSLAVTSANKVRCFYKSPSKMTFAESPSGCPQSPTSVGLYGGLSFDPVGATAWPSAFGSLFEIWIPVKTTQPLSGLITSPGCAACLFAGTWMIDGWDSPWLFPVQGVYVKQAANPPAVPPPYVDYPAPNNTAGPTTQWTTSGFVFTQGTMGNIYTDLREGTSGAWAVRAPANHVTDGAWRIDQAWNGLVAGHTYSFRVCYDPDGAAAEICGVSQTFVLPGAVDSIAPNTSIVGKPKAITNQRTATFTFSSNELGSTFKCKLDSGAETDCTAPVYANLAPGSHTLVVRAKDAADNVDASPASYTWVVDTTKPDTTVSCPAAACKGNKFTFKSNEAKTTFKCKLDSKAWAVCKSPKTYKGLKKGKHTLKVKSIDRAGNEDASPASKSWRVT